MVRINFAEELETAESSLLAQGDLVREQLERVLQALVARERALAEKVIAEGDLCVNIAKFVSNEHPYPSESPMVTRLGDMGERAAEMLDVALTAFARRDADLAEELPVKDNVLDRLNRGMLGELKRYAGDEESFEWATNLVLVARYLERIGDHTVDIGEQVSFLVTGVFREFTDASHPEMEPRG
jgi:phosphate transport system protein